MAEQSSTVVAFRALVMLICLILIPVAAFCGSSFPAVVKAIQSGRWPTLADFRGPAGPPSSQATEAPRFMPRRKRLAPGNRSQDAGLPRPGWSLWSRDARRNDALAGGCGELQRTRSAPPQRTATGLSTSFPQNKDPGTGPNRGLSPVPPGRESSSVGSRGDDGTFRRSGPTERICRQFVAQRSVQVCPGPASPIRRNVFCA